MAVYLIAAGSGPVKIGKADNPAARMAEFQCGHYETLTLLRTWPGSFAEEAAMHRAFSEYHLRGEWFTFCPAMLEAAPAALLAARDVPAWFAELIPTEGSAFCPMQLVAKVEEHLKATEMPPSTFGLRVVGDPNFVRNIRAGRQPRFSTVQRVVSFMESVDAQVLSERPATQDAAA